MPTRISTPIAPVVASGWVDYFSPQLYWQVDAPQQSFPALLNWWSRKTGKNRNLWPGLTPPTSARNGSREEITRQIEIVRARAGVGGDIFYHLRNLAENPALAGMIRALFAESALVPASPWLAVPPPEKPQLIVTAEQSFRRQPALGKFGRRTGPALGFAIPNEPGLDDGNSAGGPDGAIFKSSRPGLFPFAP